MFPHLSGAEPRLFCLYCRAGRETGAADRLYAPPESACLQHAPFPGECPRAGGPPTENGCLPVFSLVDPIIYELAGFRNTFPHSEAGKKTTIFRNLFKIFENSSCFF
jgi:hypothetical protein